METLATLRNEVLGLMDEAGSTTTTKSNAERAIRQAHVQRCSDYNWAFMLWPKALTFNLASDTQLYSLHQEFDKPFYFKNLNTHEFLTDVPYANVKRMAPDFSRATATLREFAYWSRVPVQNQPLASSVLSIVSTSASDVGATKGIVVRGDTLDGVTTEQINPNGLATVSGLVQFTHIIEVTKLSDWAGKMTMFSDGGSVTNLKLFASELGRQYQQIFLLWVPKSSDPIEYRFFRKPNPLTYDNSIPDVPDPYSKILVWDSLLIMSAYDGQIDAGRKAIWEKNQSNLETALFAAYGNQASIGAQSRSIRILEDVDYS